MVNFKSGIMKEMFNESIEALFIPLKIGQRFHPLHPSPPHLPVKL